MIKISSKKLFLYYVPLALIIMVLGVVSGIIIIDRLVMPNVIGINKDTVNTPKITGLDLESAREKLFGVGLLTEIKSRVYSDNVNEGAVISQEPQPGEHVKKGRRISIVLSKGAEIAVVPQISEMTERQARSELKKSGFSIGTVKKVYSEVVPTDVVIDINPESGMTISRETAIDLIVSRGPRPTHTEMPNIIGEDIVSARQKLEESGLSTGNISYIDNATLSPGTVMSQSVPPGTKVQLDTKIDLEVTSP